MTDEEMDEICDEINNLACKRQGLLLDKEENKAVTEKEQEISSRINELTDILLETQTQTQTVQGVAREQKKTDVNNRFYAIIPKKFAEKEIPELVEQFPGHIYYALEIDEDEETQRVQIILDKEKHINNIAYYPALDDATSDEDRRKIMDDFLRSFPDRYHYVRMQDVF